jgi:hypothetical protein
MSVPENVTKQSHRVSSLQGSYPTLKLNEEKYFQHLLNHTGHRSDDWFHTSDDWFHTSDDWFQTTSDWIHREKNGFTGKMTGFEL